MSYSEPFKGILYERSKPASELGGIKTGKLVLSREELESLKIKGLPLCINHFSEPIGKFVDSWFDAHGSLWGKFVIDMDHPLGHVAVSDLRRKDKSTMKELSLSHVYIDDTGVCVAMEGSLCKEGRRTGTRIVHNTNASSLSSGVHLVFHKKHRITQPSEHKLRPIKMEYMSDGRMSNSFAAMSCNQPSFVATPRKPDKQLRGSFASMSRKLDDSTLKPDAIMPCKFDNGIPRPCVAKLRPLTFAVEQKLQCAKETKLSPLKLC